MKYDADIDVLLIEDDPLVAESVQTALTGEQAGTFHLEWARTLDDGLEKLRQFPAEIVLLDLQLPDSPGIQSLKSILLESPSLIVLLLSDVDNDTLAEECLAHGAQDVFSKSHINAYWLPRALRYAMSCIARKNELKQSEACFRAMSDDSPLGILMFNPDGDCLYANPAYRKMSGLAIGEAKGDGWRRNIHPEDADRIMADWQKLIRYSWAFEDEFRFLHADGHTIWVHVSATVMRNGNHRHGYLQTLTDISEAKSAQSVLAATEEALFEQKERAEVTLNSIGDGVICADTSGHIVYMNPGAERMTGWQSREAMGRRLSEVFNTIEPVQKEDNEQNEKNAIFSRSSLLIRRDGKELPIQSSTSPLRDRTGSLIGTAIVCRDVSETHAMAAKMAHLAQHDFLTDLPNRSLLDDRLGQAISLAHRQRNHLAVLFIDLDHFKHINDTLGHAVGDLLLQTVALRLRTCVRTSDTLCRQGGDEFVVVLSEIDDSEDAAQVASKMLEIFAKPVIVEGHELDIGMSIGISIYPEDGQQADVLIRHADVAMYHAKENGRHNYQFFTPELNVRAIQRHTLKSNLRRAVDRREFALQYQAKIDLQTGRLMGAEALLRWHHPEHGFMSPIQFIPIAEESGMIGLIGQWVIREACSQIQAWHHSGLPLMPISVNISPVEFRNKDFLQNITNILEETRIPPQYLELELTESALLQDAESISSILYSLKDMGVQLTIDDFGTGYSNLSYLKHFPIDTLKIDQSFVHDVTDDMDDATIVRAIVGMAESLKLRTVAEGVETTEHLAFLQALQCNEGQGFFFGRPVYARSFASQLESGMTPHGEFTQAHM